MSTFPKIVMLNAFKQEPMCTHWNGIRMGMKHHGVEYREIDYRETSDLMIRKQILQINPDLILYGICDPLDSGPLSTLKQFKKALWWAEYRDEITGGYLNGKLSNVIDYLFVSNDSQGDFYLEKTGLRAQYLGQAGFEGEITKNYDYDVVFIGGKIDEGPIGARWRLFQQLKTPYVHLNEDTPEGRSHLYEQMPSIYGTSKICLDSSHSWRGKYYASGRYYHIACNGGFSVCKRFNGCEELFPEGCGKVYFDTAQEADTLLQYYLEHEDERKEMAKKGKEHALKHHTYVNRIEQLLKYVGFRD